MRTAIIANVTRIQISQANPSRALRCVQYTNTSCVLQFNPPPSIWVMAAAPAVHMIHVRPKNSKCAPILVKTPVAEW